MLSGGRMAGVTGLETIFFVPPRAQTNKTGTYEQQVVTRVVDYTWCLAHAWHIARIYGTGVSFLEFLTGSVAH